MNYTITVVFDPASLQQVQQSGNTLCIAKNISNFPGTSALPVVWTAITPFTNNTFAWTDNYLVYETGTQLSAGAAIQMNAVAAAQPGMAYPYADGSFSQGVGRSALYLEVVNKQAGGNLNFGVAQQIINPDGKIVVGPLCGIPIAVNETASFLPTETISVFLSPFARNGLVLGAIPAQAAVVTVYPNTNATLTYNGQTGNFTVSA